MRPASDTFSRSIRMMTLLMSGAMIGKLLGLARELLMARAFGASIIADAFRGGVTSTLLPIAPMQNEGVPAVLIPLHQKWQADNAAAERLGSLAVALMLLTTAIVIAVLAFTPVWVDFIVGGFTPEAKLITVDFARIMALAMPASVLLNCLAAAEIASGRSRIATVRATVLNIAVMLGIALYMATGYVNFLPASYAFSFNAFGAWSTYHLWRDGSISARGLSVSSVIQSWSEFFARLRPLLMMPFTEQGQVWLERRIASGLGTGTVASLDYARTLTDTASLFVSQPLGMAVLYKGNSSDTNAQVRAIASPILAFAIPASIFIGVFAPDIVRVIFQRGAFETTAVALTSGAVRGISFGLWAATLGWVLLRMLNNAGRNVHAMGILVAGFAVNCALNLLVPVLAPPGSGPLYIGLGEAGRGIVILIGTCLALNCLRPVSLLLLRCLPTAILMGCLSYGVQLLSVPPLVHLILAGLAAALCGLLGYFIVARDHFKLINEWRRT